MAIERADKVRKRNGPAFLRREFVFHNRARANCQRLVGF
jgi:hypothetical protein